MVDNLATLRGYVKIWLRPLIEFFFKFRKPTLTAEDREWNLNIYKNIYPNSFHCRVSGSPDVKFVS
jgi:hypothetical protein